MIEGSEKRNRQLAFEFQNSHVCEKRSNAVSSSGIEDHSCETLFKIVNCKYLIMHSNQDFSGIIYNTGWGTLPDCLRCSLQVMKK